LRRKLPGTIGAPGRSGAVIVPRRSVEPGSSPICPGAGA
jgi:hypothetical protein